MQLLVLHIFYSSLGFERTVEESFNQVITEFVLNDHEKYIDKPRLFY
ncbi:MAG: hypothetical protein ABF289_16380 [Clostridiales bacterium]